MMRSSLQIPIRVLYMRLWKHRKGWALVLLNRLTNQETRPINANADNDSDGLSPYESGYINGYNDALVDLLNALNIEHDFHHFD